MQTAAHTTTAPAAFTATTAGALKGFSITCSCGLEMRNTVRSNVEADARDHIAWAARQKGTAK